MNYECEPMPDWELEIVKRWAYSHGVGIGGLLVDLGCGRAEIVGQRIVYRRKRKRA